VAFFTVHLGKVPQMADGHAENWLKELETSSTTKKTKQQNVIKNRQSRDIISSSEDERRVISFPTLDDPYSNNQNIYESNRQNNPANEV
jgi:hypothetical protein